LATPTSDYRDLLRPFSAATRIGQRMSALLVASTMSSAVKHGNSYYQAVTKLLCLFLTISVTSCTALAESFFVIQAS